MTLRHRQAGFTLIEVLLAMTLSLVVLTATLSVFSTLERNASRNQKLNDDQLHTRVAVDALARRLRNLASPADPDPAAGAFAQQPLERAQAQDLIFRTVNSDGSATTSNKQNLERYRYCLNTTAQRLYVERQTWTGVAPAMPTATACGPGDGWPDAGRKIAAESIVNATRPVFKYQVSPSPGTYSEQTSIAQSTDFPTGIAIRAQLWIDPDTAHPPGETTLNTRVFLRNQNRPPVGSFTATPAGSQIVLNASDSDDPEGNALKYQWLDNGTVIYPTPGDTTQYTSRSTYVYAPTKPTGSTVVTHVFTLKVLDVGGLSPLTAPASKTITCKLSTGCI